MFTKIIMVTISFSESLASANALVAGYGRSTNEF